MRVQILGINYEPERTGIAPYTAGLARHLSRNHDVTVITGVPHYPEWKVDPQYRRWRHEETVDGVRVVRLGHYVPTRPGIAGRAAYELSWAIRAAAAGRRILTDVVVAVVPAMFAAHAARLIARGQDAPLGILVQDIMSTAAAQSGVRGGQLIAKLASSVERIGLRSATSITTIHPRLAAELSNLVRGRAQPQVIYNWTHVAPGCGRREATRDKFGWADDDMIVLHSGNMGSKQNLEVVVDAARLAALSSRRVRFVLCGGGNQHLTLEHYASGVSNLSFLGSVDESVYMDLLAAADVLLVNERPGMKEMSLPSKLTSYLVAGRPMVAATDTNSATAELVRASGGGLVTPAGDAQRLLYAVIRAATDHDLADRLVADGRAFATAHLSEHGALAAYDAWVTQLAGQRVA